MEIIQNAFHDSLIQMSNLLFGPQILQFFGGDLGIAIAMMLIPLLCGVIAAYLLMETHQKLGLTLLTGGCEMSQVLILAVSIAAANASATGMGWAISLIIETPVIALAITMVARMKRAITEEIELA